jgi:hypothetical protein
MKRGCIGGLAADRRFGIIARNPTVYVVTAQSMIIRQTNTDARLSGFEQV